MVNNIIEEKIIDLMAEALSYCGYGKTQCCGDMFTEWECSRCGKKFRHINTNHPELCVDYIKEIFKKEAMKGGSDYD